MDFILLLSILLAVFLVIAVLAFILLAITYTTIAIASNSYDPIDYYLDIDDLDTHKNKEKTEK